MARTNKKERKSMKALQEERVALDRQIAEQEREPVQEIADLVTGEEMTAVVERLTEIEKELPTNNAAKNIQHLRKVIKAVAQTAEADLARIDGLLATDEDAPADDAPEGDADDAL